MGCTKSKLKRDLTSIYEQDSDIKTEEPVSEVSEVSEDSFRTCISKGDNIPNSFNIIQTDISEKIISNTHNHMIDYSNTMCDPYLGRFVIRGPNYPIGKTNFKEEKIQASNQLYSICALNTFKFTSEIKCLSTKYEPYMKFFKNNPVDLDRKWAPSFIVFNYITKSYIVSKIYERKEEFTKGKFPNIDLSINSFLTGDDKYKNNTLKLLCQLPYSNPIVSFTAKRLGISNPAKIGTKLHTTYYHGDNFLEINVDIRSSIIAYSISDLIIPRANGIIVDLVYLLESHDESELPECILFASRHIFSDVSKGLVMI
jgi:hypothetical protein